MPNFKSKAAYEAWLAYGHASGKFADTPGNQPVSIKGKSKKVKHAGGGKFGDALKLTGDTLLSTVGLSDVIGDENYRNQGFADASRVGEKIGQQAGQIAGNILLPGMGGQIVSTGQKMLGNIDGDDAERARIEQMRANPELYGKYSDSITQMNKAINPLATGVDIAGTLGNIGTTNFMQTGNVLGDLSGLKNSFSQGILGNSTNNAMGTGNTANTALSSLNTLGNIDYEFDRNINKINNPASQAMSLQDALIQNKGFNAFGGNMKKKKYANGGPIKMGEQVKPGSARHKELQALEEQNRLYQERMAQFAPMIEKYGEPSEYTTEQIAAMSPDFDPAAVPSGSSILGFNVNLDEEAMAESPFFAIAPESGTGKNAYNFFTAPTKPGDIPNYDLVEDDMMDMSIQPEKIFSPIQAAGVYSYASGNPSNKQVGYSYGYEGQTPESITTVNPYTREQMMLPSDSFTSGMMNQDFGTIKGLEGVPIDNYMTTDQLREKAIEDEKARGVLPQRFAYGGKMNMMPNGGKFVEYEGPTHAGGGIDVDTNGVPTKTSGVAEVEGGETLHDNGIENYIFSDRLVINPGDKKKLTFADMSKKINNRYKGSDKDPIAEKSRKLELENLKVEQENLKQMMGDSDDNYACGGKMKKATGGGLPILDPNAPYGIAGLDNILGQETAANMLGTTGTIDSNVIPGLANLAGQDFNPYANTEFNTTKMKTGEPNSNESGLPQDTINPLGYFASNIGNLYDLTEAAKETPKNQFARAEFEGVDYSEARREAERQAGVAKSIARENARNAPSAGGAMTNRVIANALISSGLGSQLGQSYMQEENANAQIKNQAEQINTQIEIQEALADQQDLAKRKSTISQAMHNIGMNTQGYVKDLKSAKVGNINNKMWFDMVKEGKYVDYDFDPETQTFVMKLKDGRIIAKKDGEEPIEVNPD